MPFRSLGNRSIDYRKRAGEARARAEAITNDPAGRATLLQDAETWERMAEDQQNPPRPLPPDCRESAD
jgi:hypothetical protein